MGISRRGFLKTTGIAVAAAGFGGLETTIFGCLAHWDPYTSSKEDFSIEKFDRWFTRKKLYNGVNPNLKRPHWGGQFTTFKDNIFSYNNASPGVSYRVPEGEVMVAVASGKVMEILNLDKMNTGRAGGLVVHVAHPKEGRSYNAFYAHLNEVYVDLYATVERGDPIGNVTGEHTEWAKLVFTDGVNRVNPDDYGKNHSYMTYLDGETDLEIKNTYEKSEKQRAIITKFQESCNDDHARKIIIGLKSRKHRENDGFWSNCWSPIEEFRYLEELYKVKPDMFPSISKKQFESMRKEFYDNQPIILTLPLVKGGKNFFYASK